MNEGKEFLEKFKAEPISTSTILQDLSDSAEKFGTALKIHDLKTAAEKIWDICKESPEIGNAVMDLIGDEAYKRVMMFKNLED